MVEPSNVYPRVTEAPHGSIESLLDPEDADTWNCFLEQDIRPSELDGSIYDTALEQVEKGFLSKEMSKSDVDE